MTNKRAVFSILLTISLSGVTWQPAQGQHSNALRFDTARSRYALGQFRDSRELDSIGAIPIHAPRLLDLQQKRQHYAMKGAVIGAVIVGAVGAVMGYTWCESGENSTNNCFLGAIPASIAGGVMGFVIGGFIGYTITKPPI